MNRIYSYLLIFFLISLIWGVIAYNSNLFNTVQYKTVVVSNPNFSMRSSYKTDKLSFRLIGNNYEEYDISCNYAVNLSGYSICDIGIKKITAAEIIIGFYSKKNIEYVSDSYIRSIEYIDNGDITTKFTVSDEKINNNKNATFLTKKGILCYLILMSYLSILLRFIRVDNKYNTVAFAIFSTMILIVYITYISIQ